MRSIKERKRNCFGKGWKSLEKEGDAFDKHDTEAGQPVAVSQVPQV